MLGVFGCILIMSARESQCFCSNIVLYSTNPTKRVPMNNAIPPDIMSSTRIHSIPETSLQSALPARLHYFFVRVPMVCGRLSYFPSPCPGLRPTSFHSPAVNNHSSVGRITLHPLKKCGQTILRASATTYQHKATIQVFKLAYSANNQQSPLDMAS